MAQFSCPPANEVVSETGPLFVHFDQSCNSTLRRVLVEHPYLFIESDPTAADLVVFGSDEIGYINNSALYHSYKRKSICITETDIPTFRLPGLYAANERSFFTASRTKTVNYFLSEIDRANIAVRQLIGQKVEKKYLYSFMGGSNSWARKRLFRSLHSTEDTVIEATDSYNHWSNDRKNAQAKERQRQHYAQVMASSKFSLCPRGCGLSSYRLFESMSLGVAPVIISDKWRPVEGVDWSFAIFLKERHIPGIDRIVRSHQGEWEGRGQAGQAEYKRLLGRDVVVSMLYRQMADLAAGYSPAREAVMGPVTRLRAAKREAYWAIYGCLKRLVLRACYISGHSVPIRLHEPLEQQLKITKAPKLRPNIH